MNNSDYFNNALHDMVFENACGAAIRRLADMSFPISYIHKELDYPISFERVQRYVWRYYMEKKILLYPDDKLDYHEENGYFIINEPKTSKTFIKEQGPYGKITYRQVTVDEPVNEGSIRYVPCDFGIMKHNNPKEYELVLDKLDTEDKAYINDMPWDDKLVYHLLNNRMTSILKSTKKSCD